MKSTKDIADFCICTGTAQFKSKLIRNKISKKTAKSIFILAPSILQELRRQVTE